MFTPLKNCRVCGSKDLSPYLDLGIMPLANSLIRPESRKKAEHAFPLVTLYCNNCSLSQLSIVVDPTILFWGYVYRSSISKTFQQHCLSMGKDIKSRFPKERKLRALDIASNDGCLLEQFRHEGFAVVGVEPATNLAEIARKNGIPTIDTFWSSAVAATVQKEHGKADVITATNVLGHVDDAHSFVAACKSVLSDDGLVVIEVPTVANIVEKNQFDTIYHEHVSYFLFKPLKQLFESEGFMIVDVQQIAIHGGTLRLFAAKKESGRKANTVAITSLLHKEENQKLYAFSTYQTLAKNTERIKTDLLHLIARSKKEGKTIAAYGASAKGNTLLNYCGITEKDIVFIIDDTPEKQHCWSPGNHIPIFPASKLEEEQPDYLLLLAWNFAKELIGKTPEHQTRKGEYIIPIPRVYKVKNAGELDEQ
jgi:SAM-dependent methyltransferase